MWQRILVAVVIPVIISVVQIITDIMDEEE